MEADELLKRLESWPRVPLGHFPTPLEPLARLSSELGGPSLWIKRDDSVGPGLGGNKARKLEFLLGQALSSGKKRVVTYGGLQSNHVRTTAAACAALGLEVHIIHFAKKPSTMPGNLLLNQILGAKSYFVPFGGGSDGSMTIEMNSRLVHALAKVMVRGDFFFIPVGGHTVTGCLGYVQAAAELQEQLAQLGLADQPVTVAVAAGTGGTLGGLMAGFTLLDSQVQLLGIDVGKLWKAFPTSVASLAGELTKAVGEEHVFQAGTVPLIEDIYVGPRYGAFTPQTGEAIQLMASSQGILLDPVYTGKAFAGLVDQIRERRFKPNDQVVFLHTGGYPALWAYEESLSL